MIRKQIWKRFPDDDHIDVDTWAGSMPQVGGVPPQFRVGRSRWVNLVWLLPIGFVLLIVGVAAAQELRTLSSVQRFIADYPGSVAPPEGSGAEGFPWWLRWQHFLNLFFMIFIIRSGIQVFADHPRLYWTRHSTPGHEWFRAQVPVPDDAYWTAKQDSISLPRHVGLPGLRHTIGLARWWHFSIDLLWLLNGIVFMTLLFATGQWRRLVPMTWDVFPNALSVAIQYLSLDWPTDNAWVAYNSLQQLAYFITVFVAAPLALISGLGMSPALSGRFHRISSFASIQVARSLHFLVLTWFLVFIVLHVSLVFMTGLLVNLNHIYLGRDASGWTAFWLFLASMAFVAAAWLAATPFTIRHPRIVQGVGQAMVGPVQHWFEHIDPRPGQYTEDDISPYFWHNGRLPESDEFQALHAGAFGDYRLKIGGLVERPAFLSIDDLRALPWHEQITQHYCIQGWSGVAKWGGVSMQTIMNVVHPRPEAQWVVFTSFGEGADGGAYYDAHPISHMDNALTMVALDMNGAPLTVGHGAPLRLRNEVELGFKQVKWIRSIEFVADFAEVGKGYGGYNQDHEFFGYRQPI